MFLCSLSGDLLSLHCRLLPPGGSIVSTCNKHHLEGCESGSYLFHETQQRLAVVLPLQRQLALMRELVAAQEDGELEAVGVQVAEVVHTCAGRKDDGKPRSKCNVAETPEYFLTFHLLPTAGFQLALLVIPCPPVTSSPWQEPL